MLQGAFLAGLNHLLTSEDWARNRLCAFAGQTVRLELPPLHLSIEITPKGYFRTAGSDAPATVTLSLPGVSPLRLLGALADPAPLLASAQITGAAGLADCIGFVFRNLRWDVESDLANMVGDIAAHRLVRGGKQLIDWQQKAAWNLARNVVEHFTEESPTIARHRDVEVFCREVHALARPLAQIEERVAALEKPRQTPSRR